MMYWRCVFERRGFVDYLSLTPYCVFSTVAPQGLVVCSGEHQQERWVGRQLWGIAAATLGLQLALVQPATAAYEEAALQVC